MANAAAKSGFPYARIIKTRYFRNSDSSLLRNWAGALLLYSLRDNGVRLRINGNGKKIHIMI
ncbi:hypothetical protein TorRG33x02_282780 [Trema orientale]|uniref:Uncharacterized protein n=1 Tax=Trema orientale TaxID=63057 RepID=A0A2P5CJA7_TREOI|nr:hypothetical protein TorRG33x02_282780 [Trema orientale]